MTCGQRSRCETLPSRAFRIDNPAVATLHLDILPAPQRRLWADLDAVPSRFVLYGGTAVALRLGHRASIDFDFFTSQPLDPEPQSTLKALSYFGDGDLGTLEPTVRENLRRAVRAVDLERLPDPGPATSGIGE
jgi:Nucleotidyl transferase AbiEii toxin, Type IV TA system